MTTSEMLNELRSLDIDTRDVFERRALVSRLESAKREERVRAAVQFSLRRKIADRDKELARVSSYSDDEIRAILLGRGVQEASDPAVPTRLLAEFLTELRLSEQAQENEPVADVKKRIEFEEVADWALRHFESAKSVIIPAIETARTKVVAPAIENARKKRPKMVPYFLNRCVGIAFQIANWAGNGLIHPRVVTGLTALFAFTEHGVLASLAFLFLLRLCTDLLSGLSRDDYSREKPFSA